MLRLSAHGAFTPLHAETKRILSQEKELRDGPPKSRAVSHWQHAAALIRSRSQALKDKINISVREDMSSVDGFNGSKMRKGNVGGYEQGDNEDEDMLVIHPVIDGRLQDEGRK